MNLILKIKGYLYKVAYRFLNSATLVQGTLKGASTPFRCVFVGSNQYREYLVHKMYQSESEIVWQKRIWGAFGLHRLLNKYRHSIDLLVAVYPLANEKSLHGRFQFKSYESVGHLLDITPSWEEIRQSFGKNPKETERKIRKNNLSYRISNDPNEFDRFYEHMYVVHVRLQFGPLAQVKPYEVMRSYFERGFLLFVMQGEIAIAGLVAYAEGETLAFRDVGLLDGNKAYAQAGAQSAIYYFAIQYSKSLGLRAIDLRSSYPFLNDGIYRHKREWGSAISVNKELQSAVYFFCLGSPANLTRFFEMNPMVAHVGKRLGVVVAHPDLEISDEKNIRKWLHEKCAATGLHEAYVFSKNSDGPRAISLEKSSD